MTNELPQTRMGLKLIVLDNYRVGLSVIFNKQKVYYFDMIKHHILYKVLYFLWLPFLVLKLVRAKEFAH